MKTYKEIKRITGNNKVYAKMALDALTETCDWVASKGGSDIVYLRTTCNDWVAIPDVYEDEGAEFTTSRGASVILTHDADYHYIAVGAE